MLGFTKDIVAYFVEDVEAAKAPIIVVTVIALYATDFSLNAGEHVNWVSFRASTDRDDPL